MLFHSHVENSCRISTHPVLHFPLLFYSSSGSHLSLQSFHSRTVYSFQCINDKIQFEPKLRNMLDQQRPLLTSWTSSLENEKGTQSWKNWEAKIWQSNIRSNIRNPFNWFISIVIFFKTFHWICLLPLKKMGKKWEKEKIWFYIFMLFTPLQIQNWVVYLWMFYFATTIRSPLCEI